MDEYNRGMDPEVKRYFRKIVNSFSTGLLWLVCIVIAGLFFNLGIARNGVKWYNAAFYVFAAVSFVGLMRYYYRIWSNESNR